MDQADQKVSPAALCGAVLIDELAALGVTDVVLCPGARSAPLAQAAFAAQKDGLLNLWVRIDERSAGFFALGLAKATWRATALVVTSGTAVANLLPALLEARHTRAPLIALTADRPATLVGTGANQTTDQLVLLRGAVRSVIRVSSADARPEAWRQAVRRALVTAEGRLDRRMGPVQINVELTPPLVGAPAPLPPRRPFHCPDRPPEGVVTVAGGLSNRAAIVTVAGASSNRFEAPAPAAAGESASRAETFSPEVDRSRAGRGAAARGVVVAGDMPPARGRLWAQAAARAGWPLLAEPSSNARWGPAAIRFYNMLLPRLGADIEQVVVVGHPTLSRPVAGLLARRDVELMVLAEGGDWIDPGWAVTTVATDVALPLADPAWLARWHALDAVAALSPNVPGETVGVTVTGGAGLSPAAGETVGATPLTGATVLPVAGEAGETALPGAAGLSPDTAGGAVGAAPLTGAALAAAVWAALGPGDNLMLGPSQIVRQAEQAPISPDPPAVYANRGLAGIDGVIATALGLAAATDRPTTVLLGDLTAVHDLGSLVIPARERPIGLRLVIADDNGGSIFAGLEPGQAQGPAAEALERCFTVPPGVDLAAVAVSLGASAVKVATVAELAAALARPWSGRHVIVAALAD